LVLKQEARVLITKSIKISLIKIFIHPLNNCLFLKKIYIQKTLNI